MYILNSFYFVYWWQISSVRSFAFNALKLLVFLNCWQLFDILVLGQLNPNPKFRCTYITAISSAPLRKAWKQIKNWWYRLNVKANLQSKHLFTSHKSNETSKKTLNLCMIESSSSNFIPTTVKVSYEKLAFSRDNFFVILIWNDIRCRKCPISKL